MCRSTDYIYIYEGGRSTDLHICMCRSTDLHICMFRSTDLRFGRCAGLDSNEWLASGCHNQGLQSFACLTRL